MKNYIALITLMISASALGYIGHTVTIENKTGKPIEGRLVLSGKEHQYKMQPNSIKTIRTGVLCTQGGLSAREIGGHAFQPFIIPMSCKSNTFVVTKVGIKKVVYR